MKDVAIVSTGNELVYGSVQDENAYYMSREFFRTDFQVVLHLTAGDVPDDLELCIRQAVGRADVVIVTGGLGSTEDDYTFRVLQRIFDCGARVHEPAYERLKSFLKFMKRRELENDVRMVTVPEGAEVFDNEYGLAPGYAIRHGEKIIIAMPGVPREMQLMFDGKVLPFLLWEHQAGVRENFFLRVVLMRESEVNELIKKMDLPFDEMTWGVTAVPGMNNISFVKRGAGRLDRWAIMSEARRVFKDRLLDPDSESLEMELVKLLTEASATIGVAESCTGGLIAKRITDVPGSSAVFRGGVVAYGNEAKIEILDVSAATLQRCGA
ncbi:MAG TPA: nicotinamide-nucleotide amidohydrolase family protein, partial [Spirochaetota bacterium]|nr:nicotinamide-nucleotide amidohydrolase family protein [Spirochaetota bacterium]